MQKVRSTISEYATGERLQLLGKIGGGDYRNLADLPEREQILIPGDEVISAGEQRVGEQVVVLGVVRDRRDLFRQQTSPRLTLHMFALGNGRDLTLVSQGFRHQRSYSVVSAPRFSATGNCKHVSTRLGLADIR